MSAQDNQQSLVEVSYTAGADHSAKLGFFVDVEGSIQTSTSEPVLGLITKAVESADIGRAAIAGIALCYSGQAVDAEDLIAVDGSGKGVDTSIGTNTFYHGIAITSVSTGELFPMLIGLNIKNFA